MNIEKYLGNHVSVMLQSEPFANWPFERSDEDDLNENERRVYYSFKLNGLELTCDGDERIRSIFLHSEKFGGFDESLSEFPFSLTRDQVRSRLGVPLRSGEGTHSPYLGEFGAHDLFTLSESSVVHFEYKISSDEINMITLMRPDAVP